MKAQHTSKSTEVAAGPKSRDGFVLVAMTLVATTFGLILHLQLDAGLWVAFALALVCYFALVGVHFQVRRANRVKQLEAEIRRLNVRLAEATSGIRHPDPRGAPYAAARPHVPDRAPPALRMGPPDPATSPPAMLTGLPPAARGPAEPPPTLPSLDIQPRSATAGMPPQPGPEAELNGIYPDALHAPAGALEAIAPEAMQPYWNVRPGLAREPAMPDPASAAAGVAAGVAAGAAVPPLPPLPPSPELPPQAVQRPERPIVVPAAAIDSGAHEARGRDLDQMQHLIEQLAAQLNAPRPVDAPATLQRIEAPVPQPEPVAAGPEAPVAAEDALSRSIAALRSTGEVLRRAGPADGGEMAEARQAPPPPPLPTALAEPFPEPAHASLPASEQRPATPAPLRSSEADGALASLASVAALRTAAPPLADVEVPPAMPAPAIPAPAIPAPAVATEPEPVVEQAAPVEPVARPAAPAEPAPRSIATPTSYSRLAEIAEAVAADRITVYLDPILALPARKARHFEVSVRLRSDYGEELGPDDYKPVAAGTGLLARIDAAKLSRSVQIAERLRSRGAAATLFSNVAGESLADNLFLDTFADHFAGDAAGDKLVLSFAQADVRGFAEVHWDAIQTMSDLGIRFALEEVSHLDMDFEKLKGHGFDFIKLDAEVFLEGLPVGEGRIPAADLCRHLSGLGLALIVGAIADEAVLARILGFGVLFGQGMLFGGPRCVAIEGQSDAAAA